RGLRSGCAPATNARRPRVRYLLESKTPDPFFFFFFLLSGPSRTPEGCHPVSEGRQPTAHRLKEEARPLPLEFAPHLSRRTERHAEGNHASTPRRPHDLDQGPGPPGTDPGERMAHAPDRNPGIPGWEQQRHTEQERDLEGHRRSADRMR